jgi:hypothetical protein
MRRPDISSPCRAVTQTKAGEVSRQRTDPILPLLSLPLAALHRQNNGGNRESTCIINAQFKIKPLDTSPQFQLLLRHRLHTGKL